MRKAKFFAAALLAMSSLGAFAQHQFTVQANKPGAEIQPLCCATMCLLCLCLIQRIWRIAIFLHQRMQTSC